MPKSGSAHHNARLTDLQVLDMRKLYAGWKSAGATRTGYEALAQIFDCGVSTARDIVNYKTRWAA